MEAEKKGEEAVAEHLAFVEIAKNAIGAFERYGLLLKEYEQSIANETKTSWEHALKMTRYLEPMQKSLEMYNNAFISHNLENAKMIADCAKSLEKYSEVIEKDTEGSIAAALKTYMDAYVGAVDEYVKEVKAGAISENARQLVLEKRRALEMELGKLRATE